MTDPEAAGRIADMAKARGTDYQKLVEGRRAATALTQGALPPEPILVGYYFVGYDANQILRGIMGANKGSTISRILNPTPGNYGPLSTYWRDYAVTYQPGKFFGFPELILKQEG
jgi:hypothetical protein